MGCRGRMFAVKGVTVQWGKGAFGAACFEPPYRRVLLQWGGAGGSAGEFVTVTANERLELRQASMWSEVCKGERDKMMMVERYVLYPEN